MLLLIKTQEALLSLTTHHDTGDGGGHAPLQEPEGVVGNLLGGGPVLVLGAGGNHARLQEDALEEDVVFCQELEGVCPHVLSNLQGPVNVMLAVEEDLGLDDGDQTIVLRNERMKDLSFSPLGSLENTKHRNGDMDRS